MTQRVRGRSEHRFEEQKRFPEYWKQGGLRKCCMGVESIFLAPTETSWGRLCRALTMTEVYETWCPKPDQFDTSPVDRAARGQSHSPPREVGKRTSRPSEPVFAAL